MMMIPAPEINSGTEPIPDDLKKNCNRIGDMAMNPRKNAPNSVSRLEIFALYSVVWRPGRIPGMYPPLFWMFSAICSGLNVIET